MKQKSIKNIRKEFKDNGIFYTPPELAKKLLTYVDNNPNSVYDPTCGAGNLLRVFGDNILKFGQELDAEQLSLIDIPNFTGYAGDTLLDDGFKGKQFDCIVGNPPFSVKWEPDNLVDDERFTDCGVLPPQSKADWAFLLHIIHHLSNDGVAVVLEFPGILYRGQREGKIRKWFIDKNYIDRVVSIPGNTFEDTSISTCILVMRKNKTTTDIIFEDEKNSVTTSLEEIKNNDYVLSPSNYLPVEDKREKIDVNEVNKTIVVELLKKVRETIIISKTMMVAFPEDNFYFTELISGLKEIIENVDSM